MNIEAAAGDAPARLAWGAAIALALACAPTPPAPPAPPDGPAPPVATTESAPTQAPTAAADAPVVHRLSFAERATHMVDVQTTVPVTRQPDGTLAPVVLWMPTWTPGSYLIREYARHIEGMTARSEDGRPLAISRMTKNRWSIAPDGAQSATVSYRIYAREPSVRTNFVDGELAVLNGAATFLALDDGQRRPHRVVATLPAEWAGAYTGLDATPGGGPADWTATDFDELIDSPIVFGDAVVRQLDVPGVPHDLVLAGDLGPWHIDRSATDVAAIVTIQREFWGDTPYQHYTFLNVVNEAGGGLEHLDSTLMMTSRWKTSTRTEYVKWLGLVSHEFFHTWNVKRLRPAPLGPFDYEEEVVTPSLWVAEGLTSYYDDVLLARAGLVTEDEYLDLLSGQLTRLQSTPGRRVQTLQQASAQAWIKYYRADENTDNTAISYYTKGAVVGWVLDAEIRRATDDERTLDDALRLAYARYSGDQGYTPAQFEAALADVHGGDLTPLLDLALRTTDELPVDGALAWFGLRWADPDDETDDESPTDDAAPAPPDDPPAGWLGAETSNGDRHMVTKVLRDTPAHTAGLQVGDELVALDGWRVPTDGLDALLQAMPPGTTVTASVGRRGRLVEVQVTLGEQPRDEWTVEVDPDAESDAHARRRAWLGLEDAG